MSDLAFGRAFPRRNARTLADDTHQIYRPVTFYAHLFDEDAEPCSWPEDIDQRNRARVGAGRWACDDMEIDDGV